MHAEQLSECDDVALLARSRNGESAAFGELIRRNQAAALRVAAVISGSTEEAKDIVQDALVKVHANLDSYRQTGSVRSWMLRVVANEAKNHIRGRSRQRRRDDRHGAMQVRSSEDAETAAVRRIDHEAVVGALSGLATIDREVLGCRFVAGLSETETAEVLGIANGTVKSRTSRALQRLRVALDADATFDATEDAGR